MGILDELFGKPQASLKPFVFKSTRHQRFEHGNPVMGMQYCGRTLLLENNMTGCPGYQLRNNDGYIIRGINDDTGQQQFAPKPMRLTESSGSCYKLRGYGVNAQTPFGWQYVDLSDYGFEVKHKDGVVDCCILYMYDRNVRIEYYR
jgi:hypothetical protein